MVAVLRAGMLPAGAKRRSGDLSSQPVSSISVSLRTVMAGPLRPRNALSAGGGGGGVAVGGGGSGGGGGGGGGAPGLGAGPRPDTRTNFAAPFGASSSTVTRTSWPFTSITMTLPALLVPPASEYAGSSVPGIRPAVFS